MTLMMNRAWRLALAWALWLPLCAAAVAAPQPPAAAVRHVFIVVLENQNYLDTFGAGSPAHYLKSLRRRGAALPNYYGTSHLSLGNYVALISGQGPNPATNADCGRFEEFVATGMTADGLIIGNGCVYPVQVPTIASQLEARGFSWKAYMEDMGNNPRRESARCAHPVIGGPDNTQAAEAGDQYATRHNPFVYFHSIIDTPACNARVVNLQALTTDLRRIDTTPNYVFITPNLCHDGHDGGPGARCVNGEPGGLESADALLASLVPRILASPAFRRDGLLIITFDEADLAYRYSPRTRLTTMTGGDATACCNEQPGPNLPAFRAGATGRTMNGPGLFGPGGGRIGAVLLSPFIPPGTVSKQPYNHYALLRSVEDFFQLEHLGLAAQPGLRSFGADIFSPPRPTAAPPALHPAAPSAADPAGH
jgi:hypothetical protein